MHIKHALQDLEFQYDAGFSLYTRSDYIFIKSIVSDTIKQQF